MVLLFRGRGIPSSHSKPAQSCKFMQNVILVKGANHAPRTGYNLAMWAAVATCKGITTGVPMATLHAHLMAAVPTQSVGHCTAHIKYLVRQKGALALVA